MGPPAKRHLNGRDDDGPTLNAGLVVLCFFQGIQTSKSKKPYIFVIFRGGGGGVQTPLAPHMRLMANTFYESRAIT